MPTTTIILVSLLLGCAVFFLAGGVLGLVSGALDPARKATRRRLGGLKRTTDKPLSLERETGEGMSSVPWLARLLERPTWAANLARKVRQAKAPGSPAIYILLSLVLGAAGFYPVYFLLGQLFPALGMGAICSRLPLWWLNRKHAKRMEAFQAQLADALDLVARSMRAGHTFTGGLRMVVNEFPDPVAEEFGQLLDEINYGVEADLALRGLLERVDCTDLKFFVVSVNVQRETGGNLAEIIASISSLIRERFKLYGKVRVLSAEGRMSAWILLALPFVIAGVIWLINPGYISVLFEEPAGQNMIWGSLISMTFGYVSIRRMIRIKV